LAWLGLAWLGLAWLGLAWLGLAWLGLALSVVFLRKSSLSTYIFFKFKLDIWMKTYRYDLRIYCHNIPVILSTVPLFRYCKHRGLFAVSTSRIRLKSQSRCMNEGNLAVTKFLSRPLLYSFKAFTQQYWRTPI